MAKAVCVTILIALTAILSSSFFGDTYTLHITEHKVCQGETVWEIATQYMDEQDKIRDVRELIWEIKTRNKLNNYLIQSGDVLEIPLWKRK